MLTGSMLKEIITMLFDSTLYVAAWLLISPLAMALLYMGLKPAMVRPDLSSSRIKPYRR